MDHYKEDSGLKEEGRLWNRRSCPQIDRGRVLNPPAVINGPKGGRK